MKKKMLMFRNQFLILGFGSLMIVSCSKEDLDNLFGGHKHCGNDTTVVDNGSSGCLTCGNDSVVDNGDTTIYVDPNEGGGGQQDSLVPIDGGNGKDTASGWIYFDSIYNNPNYDPNKDGLLLTQ
jgi:hypothetical protein